MYIHIHIFKTYTNEDYLSWYLRIRLNHSNGYRGGSGHMRTDAGTGTSTGTRSSAAIVGSLPGDLHCTLREGVPISTGPLGV
ncbi:PREDICTED: uncharacterized protein LOC105153452 isoform X2 [Acromyrmex echinatior]|uniref:uncharacterized protein LOC105153452 isoform X2 n=1 Tax=Acromyrmex echinatior TaxID=103372 RepID=UPI000580D3E4|nr:PREDICTED: uncharacterized protein LOC105153452 isoform X2 [Acromyrmex echinatior]XP_011066607.1 PREDICTED: uncharacterized protein LOC105153452 isoform X2 [Acromyrmex echinatior]